MRWLHALCSIGPLLLPVVASAQPASGTLRVLTYNIAGLPEGVSSSRPAANVPLIGERLDRFDLALVQEDFAYAHALRAKLRLPYQSAPFQRGDRYDFGDGLSVFSRFAFRQPERTAWATCNGFTGDYFDCLTPKGFLRTTVTLAEGAAIDVYDVHLDAGFSEADRAARSAQLDQLAAAIVRSSGARAVLVGGDFNLQAREAGELLRFQQATGLGDACSALRCQEPRRVDRVLFRASREVELTPVRWRVAPGFLDAQGAPLSDHAPVAVEFRWQRER